MTQPDFLIIPMLVKEHKNLRPSDWIIYAVVYWYEHMKDGKCVASNATIGRVARVDDRTVRAALDRLEQAGFIKRDYTARDRKNRVQIRCLVKYGITREDVTDAGFETMTAVTKTIEKTTPKKETPGAYASRFFSRDHEALSGTIQQLLLATHNTVPAEAFERELNKFIEYWTEKNKSGTKEKWQLQQTFDVNLRIITWLSRAGVRAGAPRSGAGATV